MAFNRKEWAKRYYQKTKEKKKEYNKIYQKNKKKEIKERKKKYYQKNKEKWEEYSKKYYQKNKEKWKEYNKKWAKKNKDKIKKNYKEWRLKNKDKKAKINKKWRKNNPERKRELDRKYRINNLESYKKKERRCGEKRRKNPKYRLTHSISRYMWQCLKGKKHGRKWETLVGYTAQDLTHHLEKQFDEKMNWGNYGSYWHLDHRKPKSWFKYETAESEEFRKCWSLENLQPLEAKANILKGNSYAN